VDGKTAVHLDLAVEGGNGPDLGLKGLPACALKTDDPKELLWMADLEDLRDLQMVLKHFHGHARYWALACGGHHVGASFEQLAEWYEGRPYEMWYAIEDEAIRMLGKRDYPRPVPYEFARLLPPAGFGEMLRDFPDIRSKLTREDATRLHSADLRDFIIDCNPSLHDKDWLASHFKEEGLLDILKTLGVTDDVNQASMEWIRTTFEKEGLGIDVDEDGELFLIYPISEESASDYSNEEDLGLPDDLEDHEGLEDYMNKNGCPYRLYEALKDEGLIEALGQDLIEKLFKGRDELLYLAMCIHDRVAGPCDVEWMMRVFSPPTMGDYTSSKLGAAISRRYEFLRMDPDLFATYGIDDGHEEVFFNRRTVLYHEDEPKQFWQWRFVFW
jgi:hypothetical protein